MLMALLFISAMFIVGSLLESMSYSFPGQTMVSLLLFLAGLLFVLAGGAAFRKVGTTVNPLQPEKSTTLVTSGIYARSRNPMYVGFLLWLVAAAIFIGNLLNAVLVVLYLLIADTIYIAREERALAKLFGDDYEAYRQRVRRWF